MRMQFDHNRILHGAEGLDTDAFDSQRETDAHLKYERTQKVLYRGAIQGKKRNHW